MRSASLSRRLLPRLFVFLFLSSALRAEPPAGYYRFPTLHSDTIVFTAEGDLWRVGVAGGTAQRLTTHPGTEQLAAISPDGNRSPSPRNTRASPRSA